MNRKAILAALTILSTLPLARAQERLSREETLKYAMFVSLDLKQLTGTPIPTDVDIKRAIAIKDGDYAGMVLPEAKLTAAQIADAKKEVVPVGQLWLYHLAPAKSGDAVPSEDLRVVTLAHDGNEAKVLQCALGTRRNDSGSLELLVFGKSKEPVLVVPLQTLDDKQPRPGIEVEAQHDSDSGRVILTLAGKYKATVEVTELNL